MSFVAAAVIGTATIYQTRQQKKAQKQARQDALEDQRKARAAEVFAETKGKGIGQLGKVSLEVDEEEDENEGLSISRSSSLSI